MEYISHVLRRFTSFSATTIRFIFVWKLTVYWTLSELWFRRLCFSGSFSVGLGPHFAVGCYGFLVPRITPLCWMLGMSPLPFILSSHLLSLGVIGASPFCWHFPLAHHHVMFTAMTVWWRTVLLLLRSAQRHLGFRSRNATIYSTYKAQAVHTSIPWAKWSWSCA